MNLRGIQEQAQYSNGADGLQATVSFDVIYLANRLQENTVNAKVDEVLSQIIKPSMNQHQKVKAIHDWMISHVTYDKTQQLFFHFSWISCDYALLYIL